MTIRDHRESALAEAGDLLVPIQQDRWSADRTVGELGEIITGQRQGRVSANDITFFKSVGVAIQDLHAAARIVANARRLGVGNAINT